MSYGMNMFEKSFFTIDPERDYQWKFELKRRRHKEWMDVYVTAEHIEYATAVIHVEYPDYMILSSEFAGHAHQHHPEINASRDMRNYVWHTDRPRSAFPPSKRYLLNLALCELNDFCPIADVSYIVADQDGRRIVGFGIRGYNQYLRHTYTRRAFYGSHHWYQEAVLLPYARAKYWENEWNINHVGNRYKVWVWSYTEFLETLIEDIKKTDDWLFGSDDPNERASLFRRRNRHV